MAILLQQILPLFFLFHSCVGVFDITKFKAVDNVDTWEAAVRNTEAFSSALLAANASTDDRTVWIPPNTVFYFKNLTSSELYDITIVVDGTLRLNNDLVHWDKIMEGKKKQALYFEDCEGIYITGTGTIDGQGLPWWRLAYLGVDYRPHFIEFHQVRDITMDSILITNAPSWSVVFKDCADIVVHDLTIFIDSSITRYWNGTHESVIYPLNTDGIDIFAQNVTIYNVNMTNYDDAFVPKPCRSDWKYCQCSGNITVYDSSVAYSTGLAIGSVPPNDDTNCVRGVVFRNITMYRPLKALYLKSNPGDNGVGIIEDISFEDIFITQALWWTVWIGPQQQNQPGDVNGDTGCNFLFPYVPVCPTNPLVTIRNVRLKNIVAVETLPLFQGPGVILCDPENPCENLIFNNVTNTPFTGDVGRILDDLPFTFPQHDAYRDGVRPVHSMPFGDYLGSYAYGKAIDPVTPDVCFDEECWWEGARL